MTFFKCALVADIAKHLETIGNPNLVRKTSRLEITVKNNNNKKQTPTNIFETDLVATGQTGHRQPTHLLLKLTVPGSD